MCFFLKCCFSFFFSGWSSNSKYSLIGSLRSIAQSISYEAVIRTLLVIFIFCISSFSISSFTLLSSLVYFVVFPIWFICMLAETHRAPFDFSESESELVSVFNTEYSGAYFAFLFLSEYAILLYSCFLISYIFFSLFIVRRVFYFLFTSLLISYVFIWVRITYCRFRYDLLIMFAWKRLLPIALIIFITFCMICFCVISQNPPTCKNC